MAEETKDPGTGRNRACSGTGNSRSSSGRSTR